MNFNKIYKTTYQSHRYGSDNIIGLTIEFINLNKHVDGEDNVTWSWVLIVDNKDEVYIWSDEDTKGRRYDGGWYYLVKDEEGNRVLDEPIKDPDLADEIREYIKKEWPLAKRENYIITKKIKSSLSSNTLNTFKDLIDEL
jgi:hypothetical protein